MALEHYDEDLMGISARKRRRGCRFLVLSAVVPAASQKISLVLF